MILIRRFGRARRYPHSNFQEAKLQLRGAITAVHSRDGRRRQTLNPRRCLLPFAALYPVNQKAETADPDTREFLLAVVKILLDFITDTNDRDTKVVDFHHPIEMRKKLDLAITDKPRPLDSLLEDCKMALENQVKTGR